MTLSKKQPRDLQLIKICSNALHKDSLKKLPSRFVKEICECTLNMLKRNVLLPTYPKMSLNNYKENLRKNSAKEERLFRKKKKIFNMVDF